MSLTVLPIFLVTAIAAWHLVRQDLPAVLGAIRAGGAWERISVKCLVPLLMVAAVAGAVILPNPVRDSLAEAMPDRNIPFMAAVAVSAFAAVMLTSLVRRHSGVGYAFIGAIYGGQLALGGRPDTELMLRTAASWIAAPIICCALSAALMALISALAEKSGRHLARTDRILMIFCTLASFVLAATFGWNGGTMITIFPATGIGDGVTAAIVAATVPLAVLALSVRRVEQDSWRVADRDLDVHSGVILAIMLSIAAVLALFSFDCVRLAGMTPTLISFPAMLYAAVIGTGLIRKKASVEGEKLVKGAISSSLAPVLGMISGYCLGLILDGSALSSVMVLTAILILAGMLVYFRRRRRDERDEEVRRNREAQIYNAQKSLSTLEVKAEMNEKDLLNKLEIKRKELVDFAMGISEQKEFMEEVYGRLSEARDIKSPEEKDKELEGILSSIRERMYFSSEMNDFYARSEILHKDFNMRLKEAFPDLTEGERKLANLLRQGFSSKYIASLMNITPKSVEINRYRLRTKLGLSRGDNLVNFIKSL